MGREGLICEIHDQLIVQERAPAETLEGHFMVQSYFLVIPLFLFSFVLGNSFTHAQVLNDKKM